MNGAGELVERGVPEPRTRGRKWIALIALVVVAAVAWRTMDPGRVRDVVVILLGAFAARILLTGTPAAR